MKKSAKLFVLAGILISAFMCTSCLGLLDDILGGEGNKKSSSSGSRPVKSGPTSSYYFLETSEASSYSDFDWQTITENGPHTFYVNLTANSLISISTSCRTCNTEYFTDYWEDLSLGAESPTMIVRDPSNLQVSLYSEKTCKFMPVSETGRYYMKPQKSGTYSIEISVQNSNCDGWFGFQCAKIN